MSQSTVLFSPVVLKHFYMTLCWTHLVLLVAQASIFIPFTMEEGLPSGVLVELHVHRIRTIQVELLSTYLAFSKSKSTITYS